MGRRDSYRGAVKDTKMAEAADAPDSSKAGKKAAGKEKMEDLKKELTLDDHLITWEDFHVRHEGSNRVSVSVSLPFVHSFVTKRELCCIVHLIMLLTYVVMKGSPVRYTFFNQTFAEMPNVSC